MSYVKKYIKNKIYRLSFNYQTDIINIRLIIL